MASPSSTTACLATIAHLRRAMGAAAEVLEAAGAREIWAPLARTVTYRPGSKGARDEWLERVDAAGWGPNELLLVTFHQMASCRMGALPCEPERTPLNSRHSQSFPDALL